METRSRTVRCSKAQLSQEQALESLYEHPSFDPLNMRVASIRPDGEYWIATIKEKVAEFPPKAEGEDEGPEPKDDEPEGPAGPPAPEGPEGEDSDEDSGSDESGPPSDGPPSESKGHKPGGEKGGEKAELGHLLDLVQQIADKLGIVGDMGGIPGASDGPMPGPDSPPGDMDAPPAPHGGPPHGGPPGGPPGGPGGPVPPKPKLRPGETPPGVTPIGSPAFASVEAGAMPPSPVAQTPGPGVAGGTTCPTCGGPMGPNGCPTCGGNNGNPVIGKVASFTASEVTDLSVKEAKAELEQLYGPSGYKVKQIRQAQNQQGQRVLHALLSVR